MNRAEKRRLRREKKSRAIQIELLNGVEQNKQHPNSFHIPSDEKKSKVKFGDSVKVADGNERFWVVVDDIISNDLMVGKIDNVLISNKPYSFGNRIYITKDNIINVFDKEYQSWVRANHPKIEMK